jgi:hypothetical protein
MVHERLNAVYGAEMAARLSPCKQYNAGVFAMPAASPLWAAYAAHFERAMQFSFDHMRDQDALNVAISECGVRPMDSTLNWLCSLALPMRHPSGRWLAPDQSGREIAVAHLTNSAVSVRVQGRQMTYYELYRMMGLTD